MAYFENFFQNLKNILKKELAVLWIFSVLLGLALIVLQNKNKLPLGAGDFVFISILALCVTLYRPRWIFFVFVSLLPLENVILTSGFLPLQLRPYQFSGAILSGAVIILLIAKRLNFKFLRPTWIDWLVFSIVPLSFLSLINSSNKNISLKNNLVLFSFVVLFYLARNFFRSKDDLIRTFFFFLGSNLVVVFYGLYQVLADKFGARSFEVMFGRPNSTFTEPDWLGIFLCFSLAVFFSAIRLFKKDKYKVYTTYFLIFINLTLLILTLSRSAWIGAAVIIVVYLFFNLFEKNGEGLVLTFRRFVNQILFIFLISLISLIAIRFGNLSKFDIFDRARSAATSEQKITIACENNSSIPQVVSSTDELTKFNCRHINLEEIGYYKSQGKLVTEIFRKDPNVMTRSQIYKKSFEIIREHPLLGVGFGTITGSLGADERGVGLNESNLFLQIWASSGILGLAAFAIIIIYLFVLSFRRISPVCPLNKFFGCPITEDNFEYTLRIFSILAIFALIIPNLFNAGLLMGLFWLGLAAFVSTIGLD